MLFKRGNTMHMADALISPAVGSTMYAASTALIAYSSKKIKDEMDNSKIPLMGVMGAFIFAAMMINFTIPATGSSGHLGGGLLLSIVLGPYAAFITISSVLIIQALFFADGGLLALGCNIFNLGFFPCFICYPFIFKKIMAGEFSKVKLFIASTVTAVIGLQLGAFNVVLETLFSGISELPFATFVLLMQPIHLAIGIIEGLATAAVALFIHNSQPELLDEGLVQAGRTDGSYKKVIVSMVILAVLTGGIMSWFASALPDGLEWAMFKTSGAEELKGPEEGIHNFFAGIQEKTAFLPDYDFKAQPEHACTTAEPVAETWPAVKGGTTFSGIIGGLMTLAFALLAGFILKKRKVVEQRK